MNGPIGFLSLKDIIANMKRKRSENKTSYKSCDFLWGSTAEIERFCDTAGNMLSANWKRMSPLLFEALLFLKVNRQYWDLYGVFSSMNKAQNANVKKKIESEDEQDKLLC